MAAFLGAWITYLRRLFAVGAMAAILVAMAALGGLIVGLPVIMAIEWLLGIQLSEQAQVLAALVIGLPLGLGSLARGFAPIIDMAPRRPPARWGYRTGLPLADE